jgi:hypothetical protein
LEDDPRVALFGRFTEEISLVVSLTSVTECSHKRGTAVEHRYPRTTSTNCPRWRSGIQGDLSSRGCMSLQLFQTPSELMTKCRPSYRAQSTRCTIIRKYFPSQISSIRTGG